MAKHTSLLSRITAFIERWQMAESRFGRLAVNDGNLVASLRNGRSPTVRTLERVEAFMETYRG